ncbi:MAG: hypothetical protein M3P51_11910, partial [Chloroflexota bacterium]|nr:hypothetical protein [Chloroflexota bacterium]
RMPLLPGGNTDLQQAIFQALGAGTIRLVGADGLDRVVAKAGDIGVGQSGLRLAPPQADEPEPEGPDDTSGGGATGVGEGPVNYGSGSGNGTGGVATGIGSGTDVPPEPEGEQEIAFSLMTSLTDEDRQEAVRVLLRSLANAVDEGKASYAQLMIKVVADSSVADEIAKDARNAGTNPTLKKV